MGQELLSSKLIIEEEQPKLRAIPAAPTAVLQMVGITERGPVADATLVTSEAEWREIFGREVANGVAALAVRGYFQNASARPLWFTRTVHFTDTGNKASATSRKATLDLLTAAAAASAGSVVGSVVGPYDLTPGDTLSIDIDGGGASVATFAATAAAITAGNTGTYALSDGQTLTVRINGGAVQTVTFDTAEFVDIANATATEVAAVLNAELTGAHVDVNSNAPRITSDQEGTGSGVEVTGGTSNGALGFSTTPVSGTGNVADINAVSTAEVKSVVEAAVSGCTVSDQSGRVRIDSDTTGASSSVLVEAASTADDELGLDNATHTGTTGSPVPTLRVNGKYDGAYANDVTVQIAAATSGSAEHFNLVVLEDGVVESRFANLTMDDASDNYVETVVNGPTGSKLIEVVDLDVNTSDATAERPANGLSFGPMVGGRDGIAASPGFVTSANTGPYTLANGQTITVKVDGGGVQTATFNTGEFADITNATPAEVAAVLTAEINGASARVEGNAVVLESATTGLSSSIEVTGGTANGTIGFPTAVTAGTAGIDDNDFIGADAGKTGLRSFDTVDDGTLLCVPDRPTQAVQAAMVEYCEVTRSGSMFAVLDSPAGTTAAGMVTYMEVTTGLKNLSEHGAMFWPQVKVVNPNKTIFGNVDNIIVPPSGHICGMFARTDGTRQGGVFDPPAGVEKGKLLGVVGLETEEALDEVKRDIVTPANVNPITKLRGFPICVNDSLCLKTNGNFPTIGERRGVIFIEQSLKDGLQFARQRNHDEQLREEVDRTITAFLLTQMRLGAFRERNDPDKAFLVDVSADLNPPSEVFAFKLNARVGLATQKPARFVIIAFSQDLRALEEELQAAAA